MTGVDLEGLRVHSCGVELEFSVRVSVLSKRADAPRSYWSGLQQDPAAHRSVLEAAVGLGGLG
jgi:hypothetical protein